MPRAQPNRLAVFLPNWVGDVVMATPALRALAETYGPRRITYVGRPIALATLEATTWATGRLVDVSRHRPGRLPAMAARLRTLRLETALLMPNSFRTAVLARLSGARRVIGYSRDRRGWLLTDRLDPPRTADGRFRPGPMLDYYNRLATTAGTANPGYDMELPVSQGHEVQAEQLLEQAGRRSDRPLVLLNPGGSFGPSKVWQARKFALLADRLVCEHGAQILLNAAPAEKHIAARVAESMAARPLLSFARRDNSLPLLASLTRRCDLMVTNDTGARHFAAAAGIDLVTVFGSTDPRWTHLYYPRERIVRIEMRCSPCQQKLCPQPAGPLYHQCMERIGPEMVMEACNDLLASRAGRSGCCC